MIKVFTLVLLLQTFLFEKTREDNLKELARKLYSLEDKVDHLLFHASHDVTKHKYQATPFGTFLAPIPKNPNSIHQKLKLVDHMNHQMGHPGAMNIAANNSRDMGLTVPGLPSRPHPNPGPGMPPIM